MTTQTAHPETRPFEAEVSQVLDLMIHSLYTHREIFLRELISNASDALDKVRFHGLTDPDLLKDGDPELHIVLEPDEEEGTLTIADNGLGMNKEDLVSSLGTIARSGTKRFLEGLKEAKGANAPELIGQFGVGFYSAFMVADRVVVETRRAGEKTGWRWTSDGKSDFTIEEIEKPTRGTRIVLHLKEAEEGEEDPPASFMSEWRLRDVVKRYSDFVEYPIRMDVERTQPKKDDEGKEIEGETETTVETETLNSTRPLWSRDKSEIKEEEYAEFYKHLSHDWQDPLDTIHFKAEGTQEYTALVYVPSQRPFDLFDPKSQKARVSLYVKRVFITDECEELLPQYLRFVRGVVDSADLPLNVSRETLQENRILAQIKKRLVTKILDSLEHMSKSEREDYEKFWDAFGEVLKEGIATDMDPEGRIAKLLLFSSTKGEERTTLAEAVERMPEGQESLWIASGASRAALEGSPHLELFRERGYEVLFATDPIDEWVLERLTEFEGKKILRVSQGTSDLETDDDKAARETAQKEHEGLLESLKTLLGEHVEEVRLTKHLSDSPAVLVAGKSGPTSQMQRIMERAGQPVPKAKYVLELNPDHPLFERLTAAYGEDTQGAKVGQYAELLLGQALLFEGAELPDPARFAKCMNELLAP